MDRIQLEEEEKGDPFTDRLISIFSRISISEKSKKEEYHKFFPLGKENLKEAFPINNKKCSFSEYAELLKVFSDEIHSMNFINLSRQEIINVLHFLLWKYTWCIPSATYKHEPDVSLFDHLKTTATITGCLYAYQEENPTESLNLGSKAFCLIAGDISGVQSYIFDVLTQQGKVAKRLRARSLFVQLISEIASHKILHAFNLPLCNLIMSAGGNFYILAPNIKESDKRLKDLQEELDRWTVDNLNAELSINLASIKISGEDLKDFSSVLDSLKTVLNRQKYQPHSSALSNNGKWIKEIFIRPEVIEGDEKACQGCHHHPIEDSEEKLCRRCLYDIKLGQLLPKKGYIAFYKNAPKDDEYGFQIFDYSFELWDEDDINRKKNQEPYIVIALNSPQIGLPVIGFKYLTTHIPTNEEKQPITFNEISALSKGDKLLGYVKADVDNMGNILRYGFDPEKPVGKFKIPGIKPSISRFSTLSRMLETFFAGYLQMRLENDFQDIYTVFSGGDDFFIVGPWHEAINFAQEIRNEFSRFAGFNSDFTFSSGIILTKPHEPISFCAEMAEKKLKDSKKQKGKDKVTLFNQTVGWNELNTIVMEAKKVIAWLENEPQIISRGFAHNLRKYGEMADKSGIFKAEEDKETEYLKFVPLLICDINPHLSKINFRKEASIG